MLNSAFSHNFSGEESSYDKKSGDGVFMIENDEHHPEASHLTSVESTAQVQYPPSVQKRQSLFVDDDFIAAWENRVLSGPSRTKLKRPTRAHPRNVAQDLSLLTTNECRVQKKTRRPRCAPVDELELAQERIPSRDDSACKSRYISVYPTQLLLFRRQCQVLLILTYLIVAEKSTLDYDPVIESSQEILETPRLNIHHAAFSGRHSQIPNKVLAKSSSKRKRQHSAICLKDFKFPERPTVQQLSTKRFQSRLDFCDGFVGREAQPTGHTVPAPRSRQQLGPRNIRRPMGYIGQLTLVRSRTFVDETSVQEEQGDNLSTPNRDHSNKKERRVILAEKPNAQREEVASKNIVMEAGRENLSSDAANRHQKPGQIAIKGNRGPQELKGKDAMEIVWPDSTTPDNSRAENLDGVACMEDDGFVHHDESVQQNRESDQSSDIPAEIARSNCNFLPTVDDVEMDEPRSRLSTEFGNDSTLSIKVESIGISNPPPVNKLKRRVTFSEPLETVRQQLTMVSAPAPMQSIDPDTESEYDSTDAEDSSEKTDSDSFEDDSEDDSSMHEQTPESPARNSATNSNLPFTPIRQRLRVHSGSSEEMLQSGTVESYERLAQGDEIILDDGVNTICGNYEVADSQSPCETNYDGEMLRWSPEAPWKPRRPVYTGRNIEVDEEIYDDSPSEEDPETEDGMMHGGTFGKGLTTHQRLMLSNQTFTPAGFPKRHRREPSIELGNDNWPPRSRYSPTIPDSRTPRMQELDSQFQRIAVTDIPTYFSTASQMLSQPLRGPATSMTRSKTMPLQSQYFKEDEEDDDLNAWPDFSLDKVFTGKRKFSPGTGDHDGGNVKLKALTRHVSMASGTMGERRKTPLLPFRPPFKKF